MTHLAVHGGGIQGPPLKGTVTDERAVEPTLQWALGTAQGGT